MPYDMHALTKVPPTDIDLQRNGLYSKNTSQPREYTKHVETNSWSPTSITTALKKLPHTHAHHSVVGVESNWRARNRQESSILVRSINLRRQEEKRLQAFAADNPFPAKQTSTSTNQYRLPKPSSYSSAKTIEKSGNQKEEDGIVVVQPPIPASVRTLFMNKLQIKFRFIASLGTGLRLTMGQTLSEPITKKETSSDENHSLKVATSAMQGWRISK